MGFECCLFYFWFFSQLNDLKVFYLCEVFTQSEKNFFRFEILNLKCKMTAKEIALMLFYIAIRYELLTINDGKARKFRDNK